MDHLARRFRFTPVLALALLAPLVLPGRGLGQAVPRGFEGEWIFVGGAREHRRVESAIDSVVAQVNVFIREIARRELTANIRPERRIVLGIRGPDAIDFTLGDWGPNRLALDGRTQRVRGPDGSDTRLWALFQRGRIVVRQQSPRGLRESWLSLADEPDWLFMQVRISSDQLPSTIRYTLTYRRRDRMMSAASGGS